MKPDENAGLPLTHESAALHVRGAAQYTDDVPEHTGTLYAALALSSQAHAKILKLDLNAARAAPQVLAAFDVSDIVHANLMHVISHAEPLLAEGEVQYIGQPLCVVVAHSTDAARKAARLVKVDYQALPVVTDPQLARAQNLSVTPSRVLNRGDATKAIADAPFKLEGSVHIGAQEHFYLEGQVAYAVPIEGGMKVYSSTQHPTEMQAHIAEMMGWQRHQVQVICRRIGGGFGGKESQSYWFACLAALAAHKLQRPVKLRCDRDDDFLITGKRHAFQIQYKLGFDAQGVVQGAEYDHLLDCGNTNDYSSAVADRAVLHADNAYFIPNSTCSSFRAQTHIQSATAFRGFGAPQGMMGIETALDDAARALGKDALDVRLANLYGKTERNLTAYGFELQDNVLPELLRELEASSNYRARRKAIQLFNAQQPILKKGLALTPVKFGVSFGATFLNQAGAHVVVYADGSIVVNHGGIEMGQGLHTKVLQIVAQVFGVDMQHVKISATDTAIVPNSSSTAASSGTDLNARAAQHAALAIKHRMAELAAQILQQPIESLEFKGGQVGNAKKTISFAELANQSWLKQINLAEQGFYKVPKIGYDFATLQGRPFFYYAYGAAVSEVTIDTLTGEMKLNRVDILHDVGNSINPALDIGQIEGAFVQGLGWLTTEELVWIKDGERQGYLATHAPQTYKIPTSRDVPSDWRVHLFKNENVEDVVHKSKAVGEPPFMLAMSVFFAIRDAISAVGNHKISPYLNAPATPEAILNAVQAMQTPL